MIRPPLDILVLWWIFSLSGNPQKSLDMTTDSDKSQQKWFPLESNPDLVNEYVQKLGFNTQLGYRFCDVFSTEDWALEMIAQPVVAVIMLYPLTDAQLKYEDDPTQITDDDKKVWFMKQRIGNACGTVGLLHALMNVPDSTRQAMIQPDSWLFRFAADAMSILDPNARAARLENDPEIATYHDEATASERNQTSRGEIDDDVLTHFVGKLRSVSTPLSAQYPVVYKAKSMLSWTAHLAYSIRCAIRKFVCPAFVQVNGFLYELDGRKEGPVCHGSSSPQSLLKDACGIVKKFIERDPGEVRFTILALAPPQTSD